MNSFIPTLPTVRLRQFRNLKQAGSRVNHGQSYEVYLQVIFALKSERTNEVNT